MKKFSIVAIVLLGSLAGYTAKAQQKNTKDSTGYPGDHFSLQAALSMFQKASSPEEFEKWINTENKNVNNLDLNKDGKTDYVRVVDRSAKNAHAFVLQVPVSEKENQDIAVIELEKTGDSSAVVQIIGDKDMYGKEVILEPEGTTLTNSSNYPVTGASHGPAAGDDDLVFTTVVVNVWYWPCVSFVYRPLYTPWVSPWYWGYYPGWWAPWRPVGWYAWYPRCSVYHVGYVSANTYRVTSAHYIYTPYRASSITATRQVSAVAGPYGAAAGSKTTVTGPAGRSATRTTATFAGPNGAVRVSGVRRGKG